MTFTEWYRATYNEVWNDDYALMYRFASDVTDKYEDYCKNHHVTPVWNG